VEMRIRMRTIFLGWMGVKLSYAALQAIYHYMEQDGRKLFSTSKMSFIQRFTFYDVAMMETQRDSLGGSVDMI
jgi:hypothetical protein